METVPCNLCGASDWEVILQVQDIEVSKETFDIVQCKNCSLAFTNPRPSANEISRYYPESYHAYSSPAEFNLPAQGGLLGSLRQVIKRCILADYYHYKDVFLPLQDSSDRIYQSIPSILRKIIGFTLKLWLKDKPNTKIITSYVEDGRLLDVGCGAGHSLLWFKRHGWETYGVEISQTACLIAREQGLDVFNGDLLDSPYPDNYFDAVTICETLEHTYNPKEILRKIHQILKPNGVLIGTMPNFGSLERKIFKERWFPLEVPRHLYHFSISTLSRLLQTANFTKYKLETSHYDKSIFKISVNRKGKDRHVLALMPLVYFSKAFKQAGRINFMARKNK